jgi:hypothetical protein
MLHLEETEEFDYNPAEKCVADKLKTKGDRFYDFFPIRQALVLRTNPNSKAVMVFPVFVVHAFGLRSHCLLSCFAGNVVCGHRSSH